MIRDIFGDQSDVQEMTSWSSMLGGRPNGHFVPYFSMRHPGNQSMRNLSMWSANQGPHLEQYHCRKLALVGIIPNQVLFSFNSDKGRRPDSWIPSWLRSSVVGACDKISQDPGFDSRRGCVVFFFV